MTNPLAILFPLVVLLAPWVQADNANEDFKEKLVVEFSDQGPGEPQQYYWADRTQYKNEQEKKYLSFERGEDWHKSNTLTFERKTDGDPRIIYFDQGFGADDMAYNCTVSVTGTAPGNQVIWDLTAPPRPGKGGSGSDVVDFQCGPDKVKVPPALFPSVSTSATPTTGATSYADMSSAIDTASPTDPRASSHASPKDGAPLADFSAPFNPTVVVTFLSFNDGRDAGWIDTTVYGYAANGTTDKYEQKEDNLKNAIGNDKAGTGYKAHGQMKFTNTPAKHRSYSWQEDIKTNAVYTDCNFTITADPGVPEIFFRLNVDDDQKGDAMGRKDGEITDDAKNKEIQEKIYVSCHKFEERKVEQVDNKP